MLYRIVRPLAALTLKVHFRKIYFSQVEKIPSGPPVILAVNHPTAFIEPCVMACFQPHSLHFLVRGDMFRNKIARTFLENLHMIPIYRLKDGGFAKLRNNYSTFERCYEALRKKRTLMILAEGSCVQEKRIRPIKKGTARIAFGAYEKYQIRDIHIVPVGVNYTFPDQNRSDLMMEVGETILLENYLDLYDENPQEAIRQLTADIHRYLEPKVIVIEEEEDEELMEQLFELFRNSQPYEVWPVVSDDASHLKREKKLADWINSCSGEHKTTWKKEVGQYFKELKQEGIADFGLVQPHHYGLNNSITLLVGFIPFMLGLIGNIIPRWLIKQVGDNLVKTVEFRQSVKISVGLGIYLVYLLILFLLCWSYQSPICLTMVLLLPIWGYFALLYRELFWRWWQGREVGKLPIKTPNNLRLQRAGLLEKIKKQVALGG